MKGMKALIAAYVVLIAAYVVLIGMLLYAAWGYYTLGKLLLVGCDLLLALANGWAAWRIYCKLAATRRCLRYIQMARRRFVAEVRAWRGMSSSDPLARLLRGSAHIRYVRTLKALAARYESLGFSRAVEGNIASGYILGMRYLMIYDEKSEIRG